MLLPLTQMPSATHLRRTSSSIAVCGRSPFARYADVYTPSQIRSWVIQSRAYCRLRRDRWWHSIICVASTAMRPSRSTHRLHCSIGVTRALSGSYASYCESVYDIFHLKVAVWNRGPDAIFARTPNGRVSLLLRAPSSVTLLESVANAPAQEELERKKLCRPK